MAMGRHAAIRGILAVLAAACVGATSGGRAAAQEIDWGNPADDNRRLSPEDRAYVEAAEHALAQLPFTVQRSDTLPEMLRGTAAMVPMGDKSLGLRACLYVPSYYDPVRPWPLLVEGRGRFLSPLALAEFHRHAEDHGFLFLAVEYSYFRGRNTAKVEVWTRQGESTIQPKERAGTDFLRDMTADQERLVSLLREIRSKYRVDPQAVGATGFLHAAVMAYRLVLNRPELFCTAIARSGNFDAFFMPRVSGPGKLRPIYIVYGEKEEATLSDSLEAAEYFRRRGFTAVQSERIPNSGVDSRPEIAANYFHGTVQESLGADRAELHRLCDLAVRSLDDKLRDVPAGTAEQVHTPASILASLSEFGEKHTEPSLAAPCRLMMARLMAEKLGQRDRAEAVLRGFLDQPLAAEAVAPEALVYLAEKVLDPRTQTKEALAALNKVVTRQDVLPATMQRAKALQEQLLKGRR